MIAKLLFSVLLMFGFTIVAHAEPCVFSKHLNYRAKRATINTAQAHIYPHVKSMVIIEKRPAINVDVYMPVPVYRRSHIHQGKLYKSLHLSRLHSRVHPRVTTFRPYATPDIK
jgi:hypothetical protein